METEFSQLIKEALKYKKDYELAQMLRTSPGTILRWAKGTSRPFINYQKTVERLIKYMIYKENK